MEKLKHLCKEYNTNDDQEKEKTGLCLESSRVHTTSQKGTLTRPILSIQSGISRQEVFYKILITKEYFVIVLICFSTNLFVPY